MRRIAICSHFAFALGEVHLEDKEDLGQGRLLRYWRGGFHGIQDGDRQLVGKPNHLLEHIYHFFSFSDPGPILHCCSFCVTERLLHY